jgi:lipopolysaccharide transport system ATP-binding protein
MAERSAPADETLAVEGIGVSKVYEMGELASLSRSIQALRQLVSGHRPQHEYLEVLSDVSFRVEQGECFACLGRNGSGKSTLLSIIADVTLPSAGRINVRGRVVPLLHVDSGFHQDLTGRENVVMLGTILGLTREELDEAIPRIADFAEIDRAHMETPIGRFSTGMQSRLAFATALSLPASTYILDEVLAAADDHFKGICVAEIRRLVEDGRTVIFVSHELELVRSICTRGMWLDKGHLRAIGDIAEVTAAYAQSEGDPA